MKAISIRHFRTGQIIFERRCGNIRQAVEAAISDGISLAFADLRHANLAHAQMDGAILDGAQLDESNLTGANISESFLRRTSFRNSQMHSVALCESILDAVDFEGTLFGGTDITGAKIRRCLFNTLSAFDLNFRDTADMYLNGFRADDQNLCEFSRPPLVLKGLAYPIVCLDHKMLIGHDIFTDCADIPSRLYAFIQSHYDLLEHLRQHHVALPRQQDAA